MHSFSKDSPKLPACNGVFASAHSYCGFKSTRSSSADQHSWHAACLTDRRWISGNNYNIGETKYLKIKNTDHVYTRLNVLQRATVNLSVEVINSPQHFASWQFTRLNCVIVCVSCSYWLDIQAAESHGLTCPTFQRIRWFALIPCAAMGNQKHSGYTNL